MKFQGQNNTMETSSALRTHGIWSSTISGNAAPVETAQPAIDPVRRRHVTDTEVRGTCRKCNATGHLTYECRNNVVLAETQRPIRPDDDASISSTSSLPDSTSSSSSSSSSSERHRRRHRSRSPRRRDAADSSASSSGGRKRHKSSKKSSHKKRKSRKSAKKSRKSEKKR